MYTATASHHKGFRQTNEAVGIPYSQSSPSDFNMTSVRTGRCCGKFRKQII